MGSLKKNQKKKKEEEAEEAHKMPDDTIIGFWAEVEAEAGSGAGARLLLSFVPH